MGFGIPSFSDIRNAVTHTASNVTNTVTGAAGSVRDFGAAALDRTKALASDGVDLGRRAVNAVRSVDVREAAATVRHGISSGIESARGGIKTGVEWAGQRTHEAADYARDHVPGGDNVVSNAVRSGITVGEDYTRFQLGVVGGVTREAVGLAGTVGELGTTAVEMQISPEARLEYGQKMLDAGKSAVSATGNYLDSVAHDPSRLGSDLKQVGAAGKDWAGGQLDRYQQAFKDGKGFETVGMDVGSVATYVVPVGGGPLRGALTAGVRGASEAAVRGGVETVVRGGTETALRGSSEAVVRGGTEAAIGTGTQTVGRVATEGLSGIARNDAVATTRGPGGVADRIAELERGAPNPTGPYGPTFQRILSDVRGADFATARDGAVFWSGFREGNQARAMEWAAANGKTTIEMTPGGKMMEGLDLYGPNSAVSVGEADNLWRAASAEFARGTSGKVNAFTAGTAFDRAKVFYGLELPKLAANPEVTGPVIYR